MAEAAFHPDLNVEDLRRRFADGPLGVFVSSSKNRALLDDLLREAARMEVPIMGFFMDDGVELLRDRSWVAALPEGRYAACDVSARARDISSPDKVTLAGQYHNAVMVSQAAHVVSL